MRNLGYTAAIWDNDYQTTKPPLEKDFEMLAEHQATATLLGFDTHNWMYYMSAKGYSAAVQDRADRKDYMAQQIKLNGVQTLQQLADGTREGKWTETTLPELQEDDILDPLTRAWKNVCRESAQQ